MPLSFTFFRKETELYALASHVSSSGNSINYLFQAQRLCQCLYGTIYGKSNIFGSSKRSSSVKWELSTIPRAQSCSCPFCFSGGQIDSLLFLERLRYSILGILVVNMDIKFFFVNLVMLTTDSVFTGGCFNN